MRARFTCWFIILISGACLLTGCDTEYNMESPLEKSFVKLVGMDGSQTGTDVAVAKDRSIYLLGTTRVPGAGPNSRSHLQLYVLKTNPAGVVLWETTLGTAHDDEARDIEILSDSTLAVLGVETDSATLKKDFTLTILGTDMDIIKSMSDGHLSYDDEAISISEMSDSYIVCGYTDSTGVGSDPADAFYRKYFKSDLSEFPNTWTSQAGGDTDFDVAVKIVEAVPGYYVFGHSNREQANDPIQDYNAVIWKLGVNGDNANPLVIGNAEFSALDVASDETVSSVSIVPGGGGYLISGYSRNAALNQQRIFAIRIRSDLTGISDFNIDQMFPVAPLLDQGSLSGISVSSKTAVFSSPSSTFLIAGTVNENIYLKKVDNGLHDVWTSPASFQFGGVGSDFPGGVDEERLSGRILLIGTMVLGQATHQQKIVLIKLGPDGKL